MDFLTRFQGRTNFVTKEGITSVMTDSSCPIDKLTSQPLVETPRPIRKSKTVSKQPTPRASNDRREQLLASFSPKAQTNQFPLQLTKKQSSPPQLKLQTDMNYFDAKERGPKLTPHGYYTPQHRFYQNEPYSADKVSFTQQIESYNMNSLLLGRNNNTGYTQKNMKPSESPFMGLKTTNYSMNHGISQSPRESMKNNESSYFEAPESRIARMGFVERQEKVLNKYRPKLYSEGDIFAQVRSSQSQAHLPKMMPRQQAGYAQGHH